MPVRQHMVCNRASAVSRQCSSMGIALSLTQLHALHGGASHRVRDLCHLSVDVLQSRAVSLPCENIFWYVTSR